MNDIESLGLTKQRSAVLRAIREADGHMTASEVLEGARRIVPGISFATVYNSLRYLKNERLIVEVRIGADAARYDRTLTRHDHAICNNCAKLVDINVDIPLELSKKAASLCNFEPQSVELILRGLCPECCK